MDAFRVGVNYWPSRTAMRMWREFAAEEVAADLDRMRDAGADSVRIFLRWEDFQPEPDRVDPSALARLVRVADLAAARDLALIPTLFTGHMSGANWLPRWATEAGEGGRFPIVIDDAYAHARARNWYSDDAVMRAQVLLAGEAANALRGHPAVWAWDLGNENSNVCVPATRDQARAWLANINAALRSADPACRVTVGLHMEDLEQDRRLGPAEAAEVSDFLCMHGYPLYAVWARSRTDPALPAFLTAVTRWLGGKDVFFEEFGMPARTREEEGAAEVFVADALDALRDAGATGAMLWCYADYPEAIWDRPPLDVAPHERSFGLFRADGTAKPAARHLGRFRGAARRPARSAPWTDVDPARFYDAPLENLRALYERYTTAEVSR